MKKRFLSILVFIVSLFFFSCSNSVRDANGKIIFNLPYGSKGRAETVDGKPAYYAFQVFFFNESIENEIIRYGLSGEQIKLEDVVPGEWMIGANAIRVYDKTLIDSVKTDGWESIYEKMKESELPYATYFGEIKVEVVAGKTTNVPLVLKKEYEYTPKENVEPETEIYYELVVDAPYPDYLTYESLLEYLKEIEYQVKVSTYSSDENELKLIGEPVYYDVDPNDVIISGVDKSYFGTVPIEFDLNWKDEQEESHMLNNRLIVPVFYEIQPYEYSKKSYEYILKQNDTFDLDCSIPEEDNEPVALTYFSKVYKINEESESGEVGEISEETENPKPVDVFIPKKPGYYEGEIIEPEYEIESTKIELRRKLLSADWYRNDLISTDDDQSSDPFERNDSFILSVDTSEPGEYEFWCEYVLGGDNELVNNFVLYSNMVSPIYKVLIEKDEPVDPEEIIKLKAFNVSIPENYVPVTYSKIDYSSFTYKTSYSHEKGAEIWETEEIVSDYRVKHESISAEQFGYVPVVFTYTENDNSFDTTVQIPVIYDLKNPDYSSEDMELEVEQDGEQSLYIAPEYKLEEPITLFYYPEKTTDDKVYEKVVISKAVLKSSTWYSLDENLEKTEITNSSNQFDMLSLNTEKAGVYKYSCVAEYEPLFDTEEGEESPYSKEVAPFIITHSVESPVYVVTVKEPVEERRLNSISVSLPESYAKEPPTYNSIDYSDFSFTASYSCTKGKSTWEEEKTLSVKDLVYSTVASYEFGNVPVTFTYTDSELGRTVDVKVFIPVRYNLQTPEYSTETYDVEGEPDSKVELYIAPEYKLEVPVTLYYYPSGNDSENVVISYAVLKSSTWYSLDENLVKTEIKNSSERLDMLTLNTEEVGVYKYSCVSEYEPVICNADGEASQYSQEALPYIVTHPVESPVYVVTVKEPAKERKLNYLTVTLPASYTKDAHFYDKIDYSDFTFTAYYSCTKGNSIWEEQKTLSIDDLIYTPVASNQFGKVPVTFNYSDKELGETTDVKVYIPVAFDWLEGDRKPKLSTENAEFKLPVYGYRYFNVEEAGTVIESLVYYPDEPKDEESISLSFTNEATGYYWYKNDEQIGSGTQVLAGSDKAETNIYYAKLTFAPVFKLQNEDPLSFTPNSIYLAQSETNYSTSGNITVTSFDYELETLVYNATAEDYEVYTGTLVPGESYTIKVVNEALDSSAESISYLNSNIKWSVTGLNESDYSVSKGAITFTLPEKTYEIQKVNLSVYFVDKLLENISPITITIPSLTNTTGSVEVTIPKAPSVNAFSITLRDSDGNTYMVEKATGIIQVEGGAEVTAQVQTDESNYNCVWFVNGDIQHEQNGSYISIDTEDYTGFVNVSCTIKDASTNKTVGYAEINFMVVR